METTGEMNWQLLIKMVSSLLRSPAFRFSLWFVENRLGAGRTGCSDSAARGLQASGGQDCGGGEGALGRRAAGTRLAFFLFMPTIHHR